jgi:Flp pilus assembly pilin Flp
MTTVAGDAAMKLQINDFHAFNRRSYCRCGRMTALARARRPQAMPERSTPMMLACLNGWLTLRTDERGVTALEYGLIAAAVVAVIAVTVIGMGQSVESTFQSVAVSL